MALLPSIRPAQVPVTINFDFFFDRAGVAAGLSKAKRAGLYRSGSIVMQTARRSIQKMGMARPKLAVMKRHPKMPLSVIAQSYGQSSKVSRMIIADKIQQRINEIKFKPPSKPNTPPHTHGAQAQLRRSITYAFDPVNESVVVGGFMTGIPQLVSLHEYGGTQVMDAWAWIPRKTDRYQPGLIAWYAVGRQPRFRRGRWEKMGGQWRRTFSYPPRPYMRPALAEEVASGRIPKAFANSIGFVGRPGT
jgi:hypothetical protein